MQIEHIGLWTMDLPKLKQFYETYFDAKAGELYYNQKTGFRSYFLTFATGARLELMSRADITETAPTQLLGLAHLAISLGSKEAVDTLTERFRNDGFEVVGEPRTTGDGYYEAVIKDPEGNLVEITA